MRVYLATPYSHDDKFVMSKRFDAVTKAAAQLIREGHIVFSPITHGHPIVYMDRTLPYDFEFWQNQCLSMLELWAETLVVFTQDGWEISKGVKAEMELAKSLDLPIKQLMPNKVNI